MYNNPSFNERKSIWDPKDTIQASAEIRTSPLRETQIVPQYPWNNREVQQYRQQWIPETRHNNEIQNTKQNESQSRKKHIAIALGIGLLISLILCGVPLTVITTLYLQQKSQTSTTAMSGLNQANTATTATPATLPTQCSSYTSITDFSRNIASGSSCCSCDSSLSARWYRFSGAAGTRLITTPTNVNSCGADYTGWFNASLPTTIGATTAGTVCVNYNGYICHPSYSINSVLATNCDSYYVFFLTPMVICNSRYCTT